MMMVLVVVERFGNVGSSEHIVSALTLKHAAVKGACTTLDSVGIAATESRLTLQPFIGA